MKTIYLEPDEEVVSVIDRLIQTDAHQVNLVVPTGAQIWQSSINLKLLKREADNLNKEVTLIVPDDLRAELAQGIGFAVKKEKDMPVDLIQQEEKKQNGLNDKKDSLLSAEDRFIADKEDAQIISSQEARQVKDDKEDMIGLLVEELKPEEAPSQTFSFLAKKKKPAQVELTPERRVERSRKRMADIINPADEAKTDFSRRQLLKKKPAIKKRISTPSLPPTPKQKIYTPARLMSIQKRVWSKFFIIFVSLAFLIAVLVGYLALPTTEITIFPKTEKLSFNLLIVGSKDISQIDENLNKIPLQEIEVEKTKSKEFLSTGEKQLNEKARGFITIYNEYSSEDQTLVATTRFASSDNKIFRIMEAITVPGAKIVEGKIIPSSIKVEVVADQPGADYNIGSSDFTIPGFKGTAKYAGFYAKSTTSMTGGSTEKVKVVLSEDINKAKENLTEQLKNEVKQALEEQIPSDLKIVEGGLGDEITLISAVEEGTRTDKFTVEMKATVRALLFKEEDLKNLVDLNLTSMISENKSPLSETQQINWSEPMIDWAKGEASFSLDIEEEVVWQIDVQTIKGDLIGQSEVEVRKYLASQPEIERAKVTFWPFWVKRMPTQEKKIKVIIDQ